MLFTLVFHFKISLHENNIIQRKWHSCRDEKRIY